MKVVRRMCIKISRVSCHISSNNFSRECGVKFSVFMLPKAIETYLTKIIAFKIWEIPSQVSIEMPF